MNKYCFGYLCSGAVNALGATIADNGSGWQAWASLAAMACWTLAAFSYRDPPPR